MQYDGVYYNGDEKDFMENKYYYDCESGFGILTEDHTTVKKVPNNFESPVINIIPTQTIQKFTFTCQTNSQYCQSTVALRGTMEAKQLISAPASYVTKSFYRNSLFSIDFSLVYI